MDLTRFVSIGEPARREEQENQCDQQQHAACWAEFFENRPKQFLGDIPGALEPGLFLRLLCKVRRIEAIAGARVFFKLRPELAEFHSFADALPETCDSGFDRGRGSRLGRGHGRANIIGWSPWSEARRLAFPERQRRNEQRSVASLGWKSRLFLRNSHQTHVEV